MAEEWPLQDFLELGAFPSAVPCARLHARELLWEWGMSGLSEQVELIVSELMTNAVNSAQAMGKVLPVRLWLLSDRARIMVMVWDANPQGPVRIRADETEERGRGLLLVDALSERWDWHVPHGMTGKVVWALCIKDAIN